MASIGHREDELVFRVRSGKIKYFFGYSSNKYVGLYICVLLCTRYECQLFWQVNLYSKWTTFFTWTWMNVRMCIKLCYDCQTWYITKNRFQDTRRHWAVWWNACWFRFRLILMNLAKKLRLTVANLRLSEWVKNNVWKIFPLFQNMFDA